jgi:hypothetical protein
MTTEPEWSPTHWWRVRKTLPERFGQPCIIYARGKGRGPRNIGVEFKDGYRVVTHRHAVRNILQVDATQSSES